MKSIVTFISIVLAIVSVANHSLADTFGNGANQFTIDFVTIGDPGNPADIYGAPDGAGSVGYVYRIGKYEISRIIVEHANAEGGLGLTLDPMDFVAGGPRPNMPATGVSWNEAARFTNWLNTSRGFSPAYKFSTQPGDLAYDANASIELWQPGDTGFDPDNMYRNRLARYFLPSAYEWYKAAYYDPTASAYYNYPTGSDAEPDGIDFAGDTSFDAVFSEGDFIQPSPKDVTDVGVLSPYGTAGQGGNVWEFEETDFDLVNDLVTADWVDSRGARGGSWGNPSFWFWRGYRYNTGPSFENGLYGFRVASIPEPSSLLLGSLGMLGLLLRTRRTR